MKKLLLIGSVLLVSMQICMAETNDITALIQRGLFEEEANHNLQAAMEAYQTAIAEHDKDRKLIATAIFRMGECYRKQGKSAEALAQYERLVKDFTDQAQLVKLCQEKLGQPTKETENGLSHIDNQHILEITTLRTEYKEVSQEAMAAKILVQQLDSIPDSQEKLISFFTITKVDQPLVDMVKTLDFSKKEFLAVSNTVDPAHPNYKTSESMLRQAETNVVNRIHSLLWEAHNNYEVMNKMEAEIREKLEAFAKPTTNTSFPGAVNSPKAEDVVLPINEEQEEIRKIKLLIENSPDLINTTVSNMTLLGQASKNGQLHVAKYLLENGALVDAKVVTSKFGSTSIHNSMTPLHFAAESGNKAMVKFLLSHGANLEAKTTLGNTALLISVQKGYLGLSELLISSNANVNIQNSEGISPLFLAVGGRKDDVFEPESANKALVELLLKNKADPNLKTQSGITCLFPAAKTQSLEIVDLLLKHGADVNATANNGANLLICAIQTGDTAILQLLIRAGANTGAKLANQGTLMGQTALILAISKKNLEVVNILLDAKTDPNEVIRIWQEPGIARIEQCTPLFVACEYGSNLVETLLSHGANPDLKNQQGQTPLEYAIQRNKPDSALVLIAHKSTLTCSDTNSSLLHYAVSAGQTEVVKALCMSGVDVNKHGDISTPLYYATANGSTNLVSILLSYHADPNLAGTGQVPPIALTAKEEPQFAVIADMLRKAGADVNFMRMNSISYREAGTSNAIPVFSSYNPAENSYSLCDLLLGLYGDGIPRESSNARSVPFPDFSRIQINRLETDGTTNIIPVDFSAILNSSDRSKIPSLVWGDIVEIPQIDHKISESWKGLDEATRIQFGAISYCCIQINIKGQTTEWTLFPHFPNTSPRLFETNLPAKLKGKILTASTLKNAINDANVLLSSSAPNKIRILRMNTNGGSTPYNFVNANTLGSQLLLRNGDEILIPEK
jgi:ankyrin repeat protein